MGEPPAAFGSRTALSAFMAAAGSAPLEAMIVSPEPVALANAVSATERALTSIGPVTSGTFRIRFCADRFAR